MRGINVIIIIIIIIPALHWGTFVPRPLCPPLEKILQALMYKACHTRMVSKVRTQYQVDRFQ